jgi:general secretion pathway protein H
MASTVNNRPSTVGRLASPARPRAARARGVTLIEVMIAVALVAMLSVGMFMGLGGLSTARLRQSSTSIVNAIRLAYNHANATSRPTRLVFDFEARTISIEDSPGRMLVQSGDRTGGAEAATDIERAVVAESEKILDGPRAPRASFAPVGKILGFEYDEQVGTAQKHLGEGIFFRQIEVGHEDVAVTEDRVYLYFWPGGQTERASIQIQKGKGDADDDDVLSIIVSPLTGKTQIVSGRRDMVRVRSDEESTEVEEAL